MDEHWRYPTVCQVVDNAGTIVYTYSSDRYTDHLPNKNLPPRYQGLAWHRIRYHYEDRGFWQAGFVVTEILT